MQRASFTRKSDSELRLQVQHRRRMNGTAPRGRDPSRWLMDRDRPIAQGAPRLAPRRAGAFRARRVPARGVTEHLPTRYDRREVPLRIEQGHAGFTVAFAAPQANTVAVKAAEEAAAAAAGPGTAAESMTESMLLQAQAQSTAHVDVDMMLPLMFDGLRNYDRSWEPRYREIARQGIIKLCAAARAKGQSLAPLVPRLISPIRDALATRDRAVVAVVIRSLQHMVAADPAVAPALAPFFRVLLPPLNMWLAHREGNGGDQMDYSQRMPTGEQKRTLRPTSKAARRSNPERLMHSVDHSLALPDTGHGIAGLALALIEQLERVCGYEVAFDKIKRQVPTYESCTRAPSCAVHAAEEEAQPARKVFVPMRRGP